MDKTSSNTVIDAIQDISKNKQLDHYDNELCKEIKEKMDQRLNERVLKIMEKVDFCRKNYLTMNKWREIFPEGISSCLEQYFAQKSNWMPRMDPRFPNTNQTRRCFVNFFDYKRCVGKHGEESLICDFYKETTRALCPESWIETFNEQIEKDIFPADI